MGWDTIDRYVVISADCHGGADLLGYKPYLASQWHDEFDAWAREFEDPWPVITEAQTGNWEGARRLRELDADGISAELVFPNTAPPFYPTNAVLASQPKTRSDYERRFAGLQAHNRWVADLCAQAPGRRLALAQIFLNDIDDALAEIRAAKDMGLAAIMVPGIPPNHPVEQLYSERYEPIWALCQDLALPINQHGGAGQPEYSNQEPAEGLVMLAEITFYGQRSLGHVMLAGVFDRYPDLTFVVTEQGLGWVPDMMRKLDAVVQRSLRTDTNTSRLAADAASRLELLPSEYFTRNCYVGASFCGPYEILARDEIGVERIMWGADYPHEEATTPFTREALRATFADVPIEECRQMFAGTAAGVYGFDLEFLAGVAQEIGPTLEEIHTPLDRYPDGSRLETFMGPLRVPA